MGFSKPSVSIALKKLKAEGSVTTDDVSLHLTPAGKQRAEEIFSRHCYFEQLLQSAGISGKQAHQDACLLEHAISTQSFEALKSFIQLPEE